MEEKEKEEKPKEDSGVDNTPRQSGKSKNSSPIPWLVGFLALSNLIMVRYSPSGQNNQLSTPQILLSVVMWAASFVPGVRYAAMIIMLPVWFRNFMISGVPLMQRFIDGQPVFTTAARDPNATDFNLPDILNSYQDTLNPKA